VGRWLIRAGQRGWRWQDRPRISSGHRGGSCDPSRPGRAIFTEPSSIGFTHVVEAAGGGLTLFFSEGLGILFSLNLLARHVQFAADSTARWRQPAVAFCPQSRRPRKFFALARHPSRTYGIRGACGRGIARKNWVFFKVAWVFLLAAKKFVIIGFCRRRGLAAKAFRKKRIRGP